MLNLIQNENMKIYRRIRTWIMIAVLVVLAIGISIIIKSVGGNDQADWKQNTKQQIEMSKKNLENNGMPKKVRDMEENRLKINEYALKHEIPPADKTLWGAVMDLSGVIALITIFTVIVAGDMVAGEFSAGTIKLLLIRPVTRSKILLSKYISSFLFSILLLIVLFITALSFNSILYGFGDINLPHLYLESGGEVVEGSLFVHALATYGLACVQLIMIVTLAFMISSVFRSSSLAIGLSIFVMFVGPQVTFLLAKYSWVKYVLFANTDLSQYLEGTPMIDGMTLQFSVLMLAVYFLLFNAFSWGIFTKRDVAA